jgi:hypothetical protein
MDEVNIHIDTLVVDGGPDGLSSAVERVLRLVPGPQARQIAATVEQSIAAAIGTVDGSGARSVTARTGLREPVSL